MRTTAWSIGGVIAGAVLILSGCAAPINTGSLLREMTDMRRLAEFPQPAFKTKQYSSFDRRSSLPDGPDWFANSDGFGGEPNPNFQAVLREPDENGIGEYLICDVKGPGAIVRTWTAAIRGTIRLYLDNGRRPVYDGPAREFLFCPYRSFAAEIDLDPASLDGVFRQRDAGYCPIPFARRCRMVWIGNVQEIHFYQVQIRLYERGARVAAFRPDDLKTFETELADVAGVMRQPGKAYRYTSSRTPIALRQTVAPGQATEALSIEGPGALERLTLKVAATDRDLALRQTILHVVCDDHAWGQVQSPVGDFFGAAPGVNPYDSLPFTVAPDGTMTCRYVMPFKTSLKIRFENKGEQAVTVTGSALPMPYQWNDETSMHFRARWRVDHELLASPQAVQDIPYLIANGRGVHVGTAALLLNPTPVPSPGGGWWGEGDEKIFVDRDQTPSTFGTGSEDYFNYSWSSPDIFRYPYCGQPRNDGPGNRGFVTNYRWHILDSLPFHERLAFYMELFSHEPTPGFSYARLAYHYARPGVTDDHLPISAADVRPLRLPENWQPAARGAMRNSVFHQAETLTPERPELAQEEDNLWAEGRLLVWRPTHVGDELVLAVPVPADGDYVFYMGLALDKRAGKLSATLDGDAIGVGGQSGVVDLHVPHRVLLRQFKSNKITLTAGEHQLTLRYEGPSESNAPNSIGIDYVAVQHRR